MYIYIVFCKFISNENDLSKTKQGMVIHAYNPSTHPQEVAA
jgi:hypothetical protein